ncbi:hypothetical protein ACI6Q2_23410, partial [Chitinophagaceae bacterium LWZ2-11]
YHHLQHPGNLHKPPSFNQADKTNDFVQERDNAVTAIAAILLKPDTSFDSIAPEFTQAGQAKNEKKKKQQQRKGRRL